MKSRVFLAGALLAAFLFGFVCVRPVALAMQALGITACTSAQPCIGGYNSAKGNGVYGRSTGGIGVSGLSTSGAYTASGVYGKSTKTNGVVGTTTSTTGYSAGVIGSEVTASTLNYGVEGESEFGTGVGATSSDGYGLVATTGASQVKNVSALYLNATSGADLLDAAGLGNVSFKIDGSGNIHTPGQLYSGGSCASGCVKSTRVQTYGTTAALPTIEDTGEAQLAHGIAAVRLDSAFANAIDQKLGYVVLLTPEGDTHGLYVAQRNASGFFVRETMNGRSNIAFAYRIVAHPFGAHEPRLPFVRMEAPHVTVARIPVR